jgi:hypothetical protein
MIILWIILLWVLIGIPVWYIELHRGKHSTGTKFYNTTVWILGYALFVVVYVIFRIIKFYLVNKTKK